VPIQPVLLVTGRCRGDGTFADALERALAPDRVWRLPPEAPVEDLAAAIAGGDAFVGSSLHGAVTAVVYGRPFVLLHLFDDSKLDGFGDLTGLQRGVVHRAADLPGALDWALAYPPEESLLAALRPRIDAHFDRIAEIARESVAARLRSVDGAGGSLDRYAVEDHLARLKARLALVEDGEAEAHRRAVEAEAARVEAEAARVEAEAARVSAGVGLAEAHRRAAEAEARLAALEATKTLRYTAPARRLYERLRRVRRR
jgi:hypothetical protein